jgi:hypothetical protein
MTIVLALWQEGRAAVVGRLKNFRTISLKND